MKTKRSPLFNRAVFTSLFFLIVVPFIINHLPIGNYIIHMAIMVFYYIILASSYNLLLGYGGQLSFAHVAIAGLSGYLSGVVSDQLKISPWISICVGIIGATVISYLIGLISLKLRGPYLALTTWGLAESVRLVISIEYKYTGGMMGLVLPYLFQTYSRIPYYFLFLALMAFSLYALYKLVHSPFGLFLRAIREDEDVAPIMGIDLWGVKTKVFTISGFFASLSGAFYAHYVHVLSPDIMQTNWMCLVIAMVVVGGLGSFKGSILGAMVVFLLSEYIRVNFGAYHIVVFGILVIALMRFTGGYISRLRAKLFSP